MCSSVIYVPQYMKMVHSQSFNQISKSNKKFIAIMKAQNCFHNLSVVHTPVVIFILLRMNKFINDICKIHRHCFSHLRSCVLRRQKLCNLNQLVKYISVPFIIHLILIHKYRKLLSRIIYQSAQLLLLIYSKFISIQHRYLLPNYSRTIINYMVKCIIFPMKVTHKMFCSLWQIHNCIQVNKFAVN